MPKNDPEYQNNYMQVRRSTDDGKKEAYEITKKTRANNPEKYKTTQRLIMRNRRLEEYRELMEEAEKQKKILVKIAHETQHPDDLEKAEYALDEADKARKRFEKAHKKKEILDVREALKHPENTPSPIEPSKPIEKSIRLGIALRVENNNQWGRKKKATIEEIENDFRRYYPDSFRKSRRNNIDFEITLHYKEGDDLETVIRDEILRPMHQTADWNNCYTDETRVYNLDDMDESWD